jgi:hypothetical protein
MSPVHADHLIYMQPRGEKTMTEPTSVTGAVPVTDTPTESVPEPVRAAAGLWGTLVGFVGLAVSALTSFGVLSIVQASQINTLTEYVSANLVPVGTALVGLWTLVGALAGSHITAAVGRRKVQPVETAAARRRADGTVR